MGMAMQGCKFQDLRVQICNQGGNAGFYVKILVKMQNKKHQKTGYINKEIHGEIQATCI